MAIGKRPCRIAAARLWLCTLDFLLSKNISIHINRKEEVNILLHGPVQRIEGEDSEFVVIFAIATALQQELSELRNMLTEKRDFLLQILSEAARSEYQNESYKDKERLKNVEELTSPLFIASLNALSYDIDHRRKESLERFLIVACEKGYAQSLRYYIRCLACRWNQCIEQ